MPKVFSQDERTAMIDAVFRSMEEGKGLSTACNEHGYNRTTILNWIDADCTLYDKYERARARASDAVFEEILTIQDQSPERIIQLGDEGKGGTERIDPAFVAWQKNRVDARKWVLAKMQPKKYGDKIDIANTHAAPDGGAVQVDVAVVDSAVRAKLDAIRSRA